MRRCRAARIRTAARGPAGRPPTTARPALLRGLGAGYRFGERLRVEAEWFHRESEYDQTSPVTSATGDTLGKLGGEIQRADNRLGSISSHNVFANVFVDFPSRSRLTPYVGVGGGVGLTELDYGDLWARNPDPGRDRHGGRPPERGGDSPEPRGHHEQQAGRARRPVDRLADAGRCRLRDVEFGVARRQGPLGPLRPLPRRGHRNGSVSGATPRSCASTAANRSRSASRTEDALSFAAVSLAMRYRF